MKRGLRGSVLALLAVVTLAIPSAAALQAPVAPQQAAPVVTAPPVVPGCEQGCETVFSAALPGGHRLDGLQHAGGGNVLAYWNGTSLVDTAQVIGSDGHPYDVVTAGVCGAGHCSVAFEYGVHSAAVASLRLDTKITVDATVEGVASDARDLNGDGSPDASVRQSTYVPSFALAPLYWETYEQQDDKLVLTGCTTPVQGMEPAPTALATGPCPTNV
ncbi:hypothetical protein FHX82_002518 [Amycolatopsis bartoniae]|uniref:VCBS repeat-containing protein n=1 Tax=Amycolatopsis bartoniae TaxID=941986 RepID=A0A8H9J1X2_9PSEU|nr:hypothetical protein [Amycolatopsis bartoniae]MBB2935464.1 hypothetical protein [Amycolatopsis bartoniae]GHF76195.1 hypothetical protein GCM10017566_57700 [Amycolatopsis bartoniae]